MTKITTYWKNFQKNNPAYSSMGEPPSFYFCATKEEADACALLVVQKVKQATSPSLWWFEKFGERLPEIGDLSIVTDWDNEPKAVIKTTAVAIVKFKDVTGAHAFIEGEGDKSLAYWKKVHWDYYANEMKAFGDYPDEEMDVVCEYFETIWT